MWLLQTTDLVLHEFYSDFPPYAILSHTWEKEEISFQSLQGDHPTHLKGYHKVKRFCQEAKRNGFDFGWVDTCCIDKKSSAELSEAINSMFRWYKEAQICFIYMADVDDIYLSDDDHITPLAACQGLVDFKDSKWFTRGWTLQELIAPDQALFYSRKWVKIGVKRDLARELQRITGINDKVLTKEKDFLDCSIAERMSWASSRRTARSEDQAYSLLGLFAVSIPLLYGEGAIAFIRLQQEIIKNSNDESIFAWTDVSQRGSGLLAPNVTHFKDVSAFRLGPAGQSRCSVTNQGLSLDASILPCAMNTYIMPINCFRILPNGGGASLAVYLGKTTRPGEYRRVVLQGRSVQDSPYQDLKKKARRCKIFVHGDDRGPDLLPIADLPIIHRRSGGQIWHFQRVASPEQSHLETPDNTREVSNLERVRCVPQDTDRINFTSDDLERGVVIAVQSRRPSNHYFDMYLQLGFDFDFNIICVPYTTPFWTIIYELDALLQPVWADFPNLFLAYLHHRSASRRALFLYDSLWKPLKRDNLCCIDLTTMYFSNVHPVFGLPLWLTAFLDMQYSQAYDLRKESEIWVMPWPWQCGPAEITCRHLRGVEYDLTVWKAAPHGPALWHEICLKCLYTSIWTKVHVEHAFALLLSALWQASSIKEIASHALQTVTCLITSVMTNLTLYGTLSTIFSTVSTCFTAYSSLNALLTFGVLPIFASLGRSSRRTQHSLWLASVLCHSLVLMLPISNLSPWAPYRQVVIVIMLIRLW